MEIKEHPEYKRKNVLSIEDQQEAIILYNAWVARRSRTYGSLLIFLANPTTSEFRAAVSVNEYPHEITVSDRQLIKLERGLVGPLSHDGEVAKTSVLIQTKLKEHIESDIVLSETQTTSET